MKTIYIVEYYTILDQNQPPPVLPFPRRKYFEHYDDAEMYFEDISKKIRCTISKVNHLFL